MLVMLLLQKLPFYKTTMLVRQKYKMLLDMYYLHT